MRNALAALAARLEKAASEADRVVVHAYGEVIGEEMAQDAADHRDTGKLEDTLRVEESRGQVDLVTQHYRQYVGRFRRGIPKRTLARCKALAKERLAALFEGKS